jgi:hypothetical protein
MKHISELLQSRKQQLAHVDRQTTLFPIRAAKGSGEWKAFDIVRDDRVNAYPVRMPKKPMAVVEKHNVLRLIYPPAQLTGGR